MAPTTPKQAAGAGTALNTRPLCGWIGLDCGERVMTEAGADLLVRNAKLVATCDPEGREIAGGWVAVTGGVISGVGAAGDPAPEAAEVLDAGGCLVTPGLVNTHH